MAEGGPRRPLREGDRVIDIAGNRTGKIVELLPVRGLPGARVRWADQVTEETLPLGYLCHARGGDI